jgi:endonuclease/exonuclease/phosphatase family metal-dependent hydrolase
MKLITLNIWGGHVNDPLLDFIKQNEHIDIFCFQEVYHNAKRKISNEERQHNLTIFSEIQSLLPDHQHFFRPVVGDIYGVGLLVRNTIDVLGEGEIIIHDNPHYTGSGPTHSRNLQWLECRIDNKIYSISNLHGLWNGKGKTDTPERIAQSQRIREFIDTIKVPKILCGDFNLKPDTESMKIIEEGMNNLVKSYNITSTRTSLYPKAEKFADYIITSPEVTVNKFEVMRDEVSDHSPLFLDFA